MRNTPLKKKSKTKKASRDRLAERYAGAWCKRHGKCLARDVEIEGGDCWGDSWCWGQLEWAHLVKRRTKRIKFHPDNSVCLCHGHHRFFTANEAQFIAFIERMFPGRWLELAHLERTSEKIDYDYWISYYRDTLGVRLNGEWKND